METFKNHVQMYQEDWKNSCFLLLLWYTKQGFHSNLGQKIDDLTCNDSHLGPLAHWSVPPLIIILLVFIFFYVPSICIFNFLIKRQAVLLL
jgi:hypothetical protein